MPDHGRIRRRLRHRVRAAHRTARQHFGHGAAAGSAGNAHPENEVHQRRLRLPYRQHVRVLHSRRRGYHGLLLHAAEFCGEVRVRVHRHDRHRVFGHVLHRAKLGKDTALAPAVGPKGSDDSAADGDATADASRKHVEDQPKHHAHPHAHTHTHPHTPASGSIIAPVPSKEA